MARIARVVLLLSLTALIAAATAGPAAAAQRRVPFGFFGVTLSTQLTDARLVPDLLLDQQMGVMAANGVESARLIADWRDLEPSRGAYRFTVLDRFVAVAARRGLRFLPDVSASPRWASERPGTVEYWRSPPRHAADYAALMRQLVLRYGPNGSFWAQNPAIPKVPVRAWQIWNEPTAPWYWARSNFAPSYARLLKAAYRAIHRADPGAKVVSGPLVTARTDYPPWTALRDLYRQGAKRFFDVLAVHPFTNHPSARVAVSQTVEVVRRVRREMRRRGDGRKQVILTEVTWPAARGRVPAKAVNRLATTENGQIARMRGAYRQLAANRRKMRIAQIYWFTWASPYDNRTALTTMQFRYTGLNRWSGSVGDAVTPLPSLKAYADLAATYEGCRKTDTAKCVVP
jgi:hypothetical protein